MEKDCRNMATLQNPLTRDEIKWEKIRMESLSVDYGLLLSSEEADSYLSRLENEVEYNDDSKVMVFGKWWPIPRQQVAFGERGLTYKFSGIRMPAKDWTDTIVELKNAVEEATGFEYNFVLVNRYRDGRDYIGEHRDNEPEIDQNTPIASLSLGANRDFLFRRKKPRSSTVTKLLQNGSLLVMNYPTNVHWYHSLPKRLTCKSVRVNLTFRKLISA